MRSDMVYFFDGLSSYGRWALKPVDYIISCFFALNRCLAHTMSLVVQVFIDYIEIYHLLVILLLPSWSESTGWLARRADSTVGRRILNIKSV
jgi:hypothetical protein